MDPVTLGFLIVGGLGILLLVVALLVGDIGELLSADADGPFSFPAIAAFVGGMGFVGSVPAAIIDGSLGQGLTVLISGGVGLLGALPLAWGALRLTAGLMKMRTDPTLTEAGLAGAIGAVITPIPAGGYGEVRIRVQGQNLKYSARSHEPLPIGTPIYVTDALSPTSVEVISTAER